MTNEDPRLTIAPDIIFLKGKDYGRPDITNDGKIDGSIFVGGGTNEVTVIDFSKDTILETIYNHIKDSLKTADIGIDIITHVQDIISVSFPTEKRNPIDVNNRITAVIKKRDQNIGTLGQKTYLGALFQINEAGYLQAPGIEKHFALACGAVIERLIKEGNLNGAVSVDSNALEQYPWIKDRPTWVRYTDENGEIFIIDPMNLDKPYTLADLEHFRTQGEPYSYINDYRRDSDKLSGEAQTQ